MSEAASPPKLRLGAFIGVFTPTILTILGVIMYLRFGWVVGNAGLGGAVAIVVLSHVITLITTFSVSALVTNMKVGVGGAYFLISRSLGLEVGGAIGIPLYLSQTLSLTLYAFGLAESVQIVWPGVPVQLFAAVIVVGVSAVAARSTELALKMQLPIMGLIVISLISVFAGVDWAAPSVDIVGGFEDAGFWQVFAVFFPAVTGILAGVSMSGDLEDPSQAIPRGAMGAVLVGFAVYLAIPLALAHTPSELLRGDNLIMPHIAWSGLLVMGGLWGAILSSAVGSILGAPRTLQALAADRLAPEALGRVDPKTGEPMVALITSAVIALGAVLLGDLNAVATVVTMFFLTTYGTLNAVATLEAAVGDPSFRPQYKVPWWVSAIGTAGCFVAMFAISPVACIVAILAELLIWTALRRRSLEAAWGDVRTGFWMAAARYSLLQLKGARHDSRNWRPHVLVFTADLERNVETVRLAAHFSQGRGIVTVSTLLQGEFEEHEDQKIVARNHQLLDERGILAFCETAAVPEVHSGMITVAQANGFAGLSSNTVMFGWPGDDPLAVARLVQQTRRMAELEKCVLISRLGRAPRRGQRRVLIWWKGLEHNGDLMLLLAHLLSLADGWRDTVIVLKSVVDERATAERLEREYQELLENIRIPGEADVIAREEGEEPLDIIHRESHGADLVLLGMSLVSEEEELVYAERLIELVEGIPSFLLVRNAGPFRGRLVQG